MSEDREWETEEKPIVPTFVVVNINTSRRGLALIIEAMEALYFRSTNQEKLGEIEAVLDGLKG